MMSKLHVRDNIRYINHNTSQNGVHILHFKALLGYVTDKRNHLKRTLDEELQLWGKWEYESHFMGHFLYIQCIQYDLAHVGCVKLQMT